MLAVFFVVTDCLSLHQLTSCIDLEGHLGLDGRFYLIDFSRTFPCAFKQRPVASIDRFWMYYHLFRAEFCIKWSDPICADAFSPFMSRSDEEEAAKQTVRKATIHLETVVTKTVAKALQQADMTFETVTRVFHRSGLNMRYLGLVNCVLFLFVVFFLHFQVLAHLPTKSSSFWFVSCEAVGRATKNWLRAELRKAGGFSSSSSSSSLLSIDVR